MAQLTQQELRTLTREQRMQLLAQRETQERIEKQKQEVKRLEKQRQQQIERQQKAVQEAEQQAFVRSRALEIINLIAQGKGPARSSLPGAVRAEVARLEKDPKVRKQIRRIQQKISDIKKQLAEAGVTGIETIEDIERFSSFQKGAISKDIDIKLKEIEQQKLEAIEQAKTPPLPEVFRQPISPFEIQMGRTFQGVPLISTPEGIRPAFAVTDIPKKETPGVQFLQDIGISEAKPLGAPIIKTTRVVEEAVRGVQQFFRKDIERKPTPDTTFISKEERKELELEPEEKAITLPPGKLERIKQIISELKLKGRITFGNVFISEDDLRPLTKREIAAAISTGLLIKAPRAIGTLTEMVVEKVAPGFKQAQIGEVPSIDVPQRVTIGAPPVTLEGRPIIVTPETIGKTVGFGAEIGTFIITPPPIKILGGGAILTGPSTVVTPEERLAGGIITAVGISQGIRFLRAPITERVPLRPLKTPVTRINVRTVQIGKKSYRVLRLEQAGELTPPIRVTTTNRFKKLFNLKPIDTRTVKARRFLVKSQGQFLEDKPFIVTEVKEGSKVGTWFEISGESVPTSLKQWNKLSNVEKFQWQRYAESIAKKPISIENVPKFLGKNKQRIISQLEQQKLGSFNVRTGELTVEDIAKIKLGKGRIDIKTLDATGKTTTRSQSVSEVKKILETDKVKVIRLDTVSKDVTKPFPRATGRTPESITFVIESKEPIVIGQPGGVRFIQPADITKTPLKDTFQKQMQQQIQLPPVPPPPKPSPLPPTTILEPTTPVVIPGAVPFVTTPSAFKGPELVPLEDDTFVTPIGDLGTITTTPPVTIDTTMLKGKTELKLGTRIKQIGSLEIKTKLKEQTLLKTTPGLKSETQLKELQGIRTELKELQTLKQTQRLKLQQKIAQRLQPTPKKPTPPTPPLVPPPIKLPGLARAIEKVKKMKKGEFEVFVRKFEKDVSIGKFETQPEAKQALVKRLKTTIRASGFVERKGKKISPAQLGFFGFEFRASKTDPFRVVQKKEKRLSGFGEVQEIQFFKKQKRRKKGKSIFGL